MQLIEAPATPPAPAKSALDLMQEASDAFYRSAVSIGVHPFIEFAGLMNEYIKACAHAQEKGIDFAECNTHSGKDLPLEDFMVSYINEKLECIFTGRSVMQGDTPEEGQGCWMALLSLRSALSTFKGHGMPGFKDRAQAYLVMSAADGLLKKKFPDYVAQ